MRKSIIYWSVGFILWLIGYFVVPFIFSLMYTPQPTTLIKLIQWVYFVVAILILLIGVEEWK